MLKKKYPLVSIITVSYKDDSYLPQLLTSIERLDYPKASLEILVVSILGKKIKNSNISLKQIFINRKVGYSEAVNKGISQSRGTYLFLPNPDVAIEKSALSRLVNYLEKDNNVGIVGGKIFSLDNPKKISPNDLPCRDFNQITGKLLLVSVVELAKVKRPQEFFWLCGNGIVLKKKVWQEARKYDESYFLYWEDADFSMKVRALGYKSVMVPDAKLFHKGSASVGVTDDQVYYVVRNGSYFLNNYTGLVGRLLLHTKNIFVLISKSIQKVLSSSDKSKTQAFIDGVTDFYKGKRGMRDRNLVI